MWSWTFIRSGCMSNAVAVVKLPVTLVACNYSCHSFCRISSLQPFIFKICACACQGFVVLQLIWLVHISSAKSLSRKIRNSLNYFGGFFSPGNFVRKLSKIIDAWSVRIFCFTLSNSTSGNSHHFSGLAHFFFWFFPRS